ncbi:virulence factor BrkB family protein [Colwellia sp. MB02u-18]|uniref:virulence factor BrkB family protein n=1 Tax=unclassified Colwellia TaxID=196834 RepID=UPI0015F64327|nr:MULTISPECIES: virulence factor BrkB family protein [unclassified Colwellia]MBA6223408.1 virulence factor BrkB family protein [Colwellia sp. MB3u-45]MBA6267933.1 virulence factor BrkB family protein [Colwellia sp. MB3u-43]MBA6321592.1 virulence factor BrkB family protein [Colwellia sp. MB02u-19]MBA6325409.1 virulence factor BrkB family protein [Colwellia sp. MB02u-18]MBA6330076.1 virulence factor BrkB family protein [Colwellia sp. MB02u-12]
MHPRIEEIKQHRYVKSILGFLLLFFNNFQKERIHVTAGYLSYVTLMSLVPLMVVMLSVMTAFPIFSEIRELIENFIYQNFVPASGDVVQEHITGFVSNASKMSAIAITALFIFAMLLISAIDQCLNKLWRVNEKRRIITSFSMYWMVLSLGPVLVGSSLVMTSYILSLVSIGDYDLLGLSNIAVQALPLVASIAAFFILYMVVPNKVVPARFALAGATLAAVLFEIAKKSFAIYVTQLPSYEAIYGALSSIPILFLWVYLSWLVVLVGALFTVSLEDYDSEKKAKSSQQAAD